MEKTNLFTKFMAITGKTEEEAKKLITCEKLSVLVVNTLKPESATFEEKLKTYPQLQKVEAFPHVYLITNNKQEITHMPEFAHGLFYVQNASSLLPVVALQPDPADKVLDLCAAPGGKTFNICRLTENKAHVEVNEAEKHRFLDLKQVINLYDLNVAHMHMAPGQGLFHTCSTQFTKILVDAPCSAEGLISAYTQENPQYWNQKKVKQLRILQKKLLNSAYHMLEPEGTLVYSTCTYSPEENEEVVNWLISTYADMQVVPIEEVTGLKAQNFVPGLQKWNNKVFSTELTYTIRVLPTALYEGFFIAKLQKKH